MPFPDAAVALTPDAPLLELLAKAADVCLKPARHAVRFTGSEPSTIGDCSDCCLRIEARDEAGGRLPERDLELEIYRSGADLNLRLSQVADEQAPLLWHGGHAVWLRSDSGEACPAPPAGAPLEALGR
ncbi:MAG: hypothetical protein ACKO1Q_09615, partial [Vulcanococcus sp.]